MAGESVILARLLRVTYEATVPGTVTPYYDLPSGTLTAQTPLSLPVTSGEQVATLALGQAKFRLCKFKWSSSFGGGLYLYSASIYARRIGRTATDWAWIPVPIPGSSDAVLEVQMPIPPSPEEWTPVQMPIPPSPEEWQRLMMPIEPSDEMSRMVELAMDE